MRVLVDTSTWVDFFNGHRGPHANALADLIADEADLLTCGVIAAEVLQGFKHSRSVAKVEGHFRDMEWVPPREPETYVEAAGLYRQLRSKGITIRSTIDCLIARLADEHRALLLARDRDLKAIADSKLLRLRLYPLA